MKDLSTLLREADPAVNEPELPPFHAGAIRRVVVDAARRPDVVRTPWQQPLAVIAMVALTLAAGVVAGRRLPAPERAAEAPAIVPDGGIERRQLQFATPGGTRIIWVFDPEFDVKETVP